MKSSYPEEHLCLLPAWSYGTSTTHCSRRAGSEPRSSRPRSRLPRAGSWRNVPDPTGKLEPALFAAACVENGIQADPEHFEASRRPRNRGIETGRRSSRSEEESFQGSARSWRPSPNSRGSFRRSFRGTRLRSGRAKLEIFDLARWLDLSCAVGGEDGAARPELVLAAWNRVHSIRGRSFTARQTIVIGDTPADVDAALKNQCRIVAVATGRTTAEELAAAGADLVLPDLSDRRAALNAILRSDDSVSGL